jgi:protein-S-isoprenylcysteine O-methyltransferase Ste14
MTLGHIFATLCWAWGASEIVLQVVKRTSRGGGTLKDRGSLWLLLPSIWLSIWLATWYGETHPHTMPGGSQSLGIAAILIMLIGLAIRWTAILSLGRSFSTNVAIHTTQTLHKTGLYRWVRHPSYSGMMLSFTAVGLAERNWVSLAIMLVCPTAALLYRIHVEEAALTEAFGQQYIDYSKETKRLVPGIY